MEIPNGTTGKKREEGTYGQTGIIITVEG